MTEAIPLALMFAGVFVTAACIVLTFAGSGGTRRVLGRRAEAAADRWRRRRRGGADTPPSVKKAETRGSHGLDRLAARLLPRAALMRNRLERTGRRLSVGGYLLTSVTLAVAVVVIAVGPFGLGPTLAVAVGVAVGAGLPHLVVGRMIAARLGRFSTVFPDAIDLIVRSLRSGLPLGESLASAGREMRGPVGEEFQRVTDAVTLGQPLEEALWDAAGRLGAAEFKFFVVSLSVQRETGGNLAETLANLSDLLRRRRQMRLKIRAMSSEARASAMILGALPFLMFGIITLLNRDYEMTLFVDARGQMMVIAGVVSLLMGIGVMVRMVKFDI